MVSEVVPLKDALIKKQVKKAFKNWYYTFKEDFNENTKLSEISLSTIKVLAVCRDDTSFYLYDLIMNLRNLGSGLDFYELAGDDRLKVLDVYLFILDRVRFEAMKRLGWLRSYPGEDIPIVEMVLRYDEIHSSIERMVPILSEEHEAYEEFLKASDYDREGIVRKLIPSMIKTFEKGKGV
jgi:hypothetical protein